MHHRPVHGDFSTTDGRPFQVAVRYVDFFLMLLVKPELVGSSAGMAAFALQGTHPSTGQVAGRFVDVFSMFRVEPALMGSLWLFFALQGTLPTTEQVIARYADIFDVTGQTALIRFSMAAFCFAGHAPDGRSVAAMVCTCRPVQGDLLDSGLVQ